MNALVGSIHALKRQPQSSEALKLLQRIAAQVRPAMEKRGWRVKTLREFFPGNPNLLGLNVNGGFEIRIRLRPAHDPTQFLRYEDLVGTMLHELVHNVRGPHDAAFYRLLDELKAETEQLMAKGYTGDGFYSSGMRVGTGVSHNAPRSQLRDRTLKAIEARQRKQALGGRPRTLGESQNAKAWRAEQARYTPAQMAARAAERRLRDERWCGEAMAGVVDETKPSSDDDDVVFVGSTMAAPSEPIVISDSE
ncbi:hypothetical protein EC988_002880 [Linderina pennispora]|nr:hypothetical protein EC988_002880 [Linderina pennispora]